jgi:hypothetical protein
MLARRARELQAFWREKKSRAASPAQKIVSTLFPLSGFDLDLRATLLDARQGSSRDLDHQSASRPD